MEEYEREQIQIVLNYIAIKLNKRIKNMRSACERRHATCVIIQRVTCCNRNGEIKKNETFRINLLNLLKTGITLFFKIKLICFRILKSIRF